MVMIALADGGSAPRLQYLMRKKNRSLSTGKLQIPLCLLLISKGSVTLTNTSSAGHKLTVDSYAYLPPNFEHSVKCDVSPTLVVFEKRYASLDNLITKQILGSTDKQLLLETSSGGKLRIVVC
ncbi:hypothetical protein GH714_038213 [Hevea brasiliensis]|uniref:AraC-type arabinose-binding/dimerisation domain-containing protein n=1 Tax=Hevea brasiliensis TaxID=3981 RepID=A0A6A6MN52_HEVBR|nr:hypothetical protein GH714_038213 [Hevea brasiliensis]